MRRLLLVVMLAITTSGCAGRGTDQCMVAACAGTAVEGIRYIPSPEGGPVLVFSDSRHPAAFAAAVRALPSSLPRSTAGRRSCATGDGTLVLTLADGTNRSYGPCAKPASIANATKALLDAVGDGPPPT